MEDIFTMKELTKDKLAIYWAMFGALTFGTLFMIGDSQNITGYTLKVYEITSSVWSYMTIFIIWIFISLIIFGIWEGKFKFKKCHYKHQ